MLDAKDLGSALRVGPIQLPGCAVLAPMSGVTDVAMRRISARFGASLVISEMVASDDYVRGEEESRVRAEGQGLDLHVVQIAGCDPHWMGEAARLAEASGAAMVDINMGCPAKRVTGGYAGSALMRTPDLALRLIEATVRAVSMLSRSELIVFTTRVSRSTSPTSCGAKVIATTTATPIS